MNVDVSINVLDVVLSDVPIPISCGFKAGHPDGMYAILCSGFDVVKVLPLHEVKRATAVKVVRYGNPFARIHRIFDFSIRFARLGPSKGFLRQDYAESRRGRWLC